MNCMIFLSISALRTCLEMIPFTFIAHKLDVCEYQARLLPKVAHGRMMAVVC